MNPKSEEKIVKNGSIMQCSNGDTFSWTASPIIIYDHIEQTNEIMEFEHDLQDIKPQDY